MNTWGYLFPIAVLLLLAGAMLYARFASRSREKSLHHPPVEWSFPTETISIAPPEEAAQETPEEREPLLRLDRHVMPAEDKSSARDRVYLDELQEAAAGLAKLMRSSPVARTEPVVFAPVLAEEEIEESRAVEPPVVDEAIGTMPEAEEFPEAELLPVEEVGAPEVTEEAIGWFEPEPREESLSRPKTLRELLGETVAEQFERIDEELDALETLVLGIETGFASLSLLGRNEAAEETAVHVAEAA